MGKKCDFSEKRKSLMKALKRITENLENSPSCCIKPYSCAPCCPNKTYLPCGPPNCRCKLVKNCSYSSHPTPKCGPFPDNTFSLSQNCCTQVSKCKPSAPFCHFNNGVRCCKQSNCCCFRRNCHYKYYCGAPRCCVNYKRCCPSSCETKCRYHSRCSCRKPLCPQSNEYSPKIKYKKALEGNLCFGCNTISLPRSSSDTALVIPKKGKPLTCSKSVELRGSKLYRGCDCDKRNGLQDRCRRYCCINNPNCRTLPASCHCSKYSCGKHLSILFGKKKHKSYTCYICGPPTYPCMPCYPNSPNTCYCHCCCQKKCDTECQCSPEKVEVECCCEPSPERCSSLQISCLSSPNPLREPYRLSNPCPEPCISCVEPCIDSSYTEPVCNPCDCENSCFCDDCGHEIDENCACHFEGYPLPFASCQTHNY